MAMSSFLFSYLSRRHHCLALAGLTEACHLLSVRILVSSQTREAMLSPPCDDTSLSGISASSPSTGQHRVITPPPLPLTWPTDQYYYIGGGGLERWLSWRDDCCASLWT